MGNTLTEEEKRELDEAIHHYPNRQGACIDALKIVQRSRGWVSDEALRAIGDYLGLREAEVDSIATFYNLVFRKPVGKKRDPALR